MNLPRWSTCKATVLSGLKYSTNNYLPKWSVCEGTVPSGLKNFFYEQIICHNDLFARQNSPIRSEKNILWTICHTELIAKQQWHQVCETSVWTICQKELIAKQQHHQARDNFLWTICQNELPAKQEYHQVWDSSLPPEDSGRGLAWTISGLYKQSAKMNYLQNNNTIRSEAVAYPWGQRLWACSIVWTIWWACSIAWTIWWACSIVWTICQTELPAKQQHHQVWGSCLPRGRWPWARRTVQIVWWACRIVWTVCQNELPAEQWH